jgi:hypothetical protein
LSDGAESATQDRHVVHRLSIKNPVTRPDAGGQFGLP